jgi:hypothetical protein
MLAPVGFDDGYDPAAVFLGVVTNGAPVPHW